MADLVTIANGTKEDIVLPNVRDADGRVWGSVVMRPGLRSGLHRAHWEAIQALEQPQIDALSMALHSGGLAEVKPKPKPAPKAEPDAEADTKPAVKLPKGQGAGLRATPLSDAVEPGEPVKSTPAPKKAKKTKAKAKAKK